jgi:hypothetical protein
MKRSSSYGLLLKWKRNKFAKATQGTSSGMATR